ncbi:hypothetical protein V5O48_016171 [Marasmius crinis-equi]|uniref:Uncharacterized protein n=1 Tax=Marasmius crinis-equi TaxID=585013 RepID=A0ABR3ESS5_9AGAR
MTSPPQPYSAVSTYPTTESTVPECLLTSMEHAHAAVSQLGSSTSHKVSASGSNTILSDPTNELELGDHHSGYHRSNSQFAALRSFNDQLLHAGASATLGTPIYPHTHPPRSDSSFEGLPSDSTGVSAYASDYPDLGTFYSDLQTSRFVPLASVLSLGPSAACPLPTLDYSNTSEKSWEWNTAETSSLKRKERETSGLDSFLEGNAKHARLVETDESGTTHAQQAGCGGYSETSEGDRAGGSPGRQLYEFTEGVGGPDVQMSESEDENTRLREENKRLMRMLERLGSNRVV